MKNFLLILACAAVMAACAPSYAGTSIDVRNSDGTITPLAGVNGQVTTTTTPGDDAPNDVKRVEGQFYYKVATADLQIKGAPGFVHSVTCATAAGAAVAAAGAVTIRDALTETTPVAATIGIPAAAFVPFTVVLDMVMPIGIFFAYDATLTAASVSCTVTYR